MFSNQIVYKLKYKLFPNSSPFSHKTDANLTDSYWWTQVLELACYWRIGKSEIKDVKYRLTRLWQGWQLELFLANVKTTRTKRYKNGICNTIFRLIGCYFLWKPKNLFFKIKLVYIEGLVELNDCEIALFQSYLRCFLQKC